MTADPARLRDPALVQVPAGATPFNSGEVRPGQVFRTTLTVPGTYRYVCLPHHDVFGMTGVVEVTP